MSEVGLRALQQNAAEVVSLAEAGETVTITRHGRRIAQLSPIAASQLDQLVSSGLARAPRRSVRDLAPAVGRGAGRSLGELIADARDVERS